ncbi:hypothetical protein EV426DRAFT_47550 [Tirmania nivea]|nr:hypothetical protein EV426DRAFT_47550 [Tirmania nivea]
MTTPQIMSTRHTPQYSFTTSSPKAQMRRDSLGGAYGVPVLSYTSLSSPRLAKKRAFVEDDDDIFTSSLSSSPVKRSKAALRDTNMTIHCDELSSGIGMKKTVLGEKTNVPTLASKPSIKMGDEKKVRHIKLVDSKKATFIKKRPLSAASPSPQRMARKSTTLSRFASSSKSSETGRHRALERARALYSSSPLRTAVSSSGESDGGVLLAAATAAPMTEVPESWMFDVYEDSHAETMQNLMEHSATVLDISDDSEDEKWGIDEISQKGKENISPERLTELMAGAGKDSMQVDAKERMVSKEQRVALGELEVLKFYPKEEEEVKKAEESKREAAAVVLDSGNVPSLDAPTPGLGGGAGFEVWASEGELDEESDGESGVPLTPPKGLEQKVKIVLEDEFDECASECGASDKEN